MLYLDLQGSFAHHLIHSTLSLRHNLVLTTYIQTQSRKPTLITSRTNVNAKSFIGLTLDSIFHFQRRKVFGMLSMVLMVSVGCFVQGYLYPWTLTLDINPVHLDLENDLILSLYFFSKMLKKF